LGDRFTVFGIGGGEQSTHAVDLLLIDLVSGILVIAFAAHVERVHHH
jgi:hypothetical protein